MLLRLIIGGVGFAIVLAFFLVWGITPIHAQNNFSSGSTGVNGPFAPTASQTIQLPESGVLNYTTINIPGNVTITYARNTRNTPVTLLASENVTIAGTININGLTGERNGRGGAGGPGGFNGGGGGFGFDITFAGTAGDGPGGGGGGGGSGNNIGGGGGGGYASDGANGTVTHPATVVGQGGPRYGSSTLLPLIGGSGAGGGGATPNNHGGAGGGGGGAILIASSGTITFTGTINAYGGGGENGNGAYATGSNDGGGGGGAGGAVRLVANIITGTNAGSGSINVSGGGIAGSVQGNAQGGKGAPGFVRIEAFDFTGFNPSLPSIPSASFAQPNPVTLPNTPGLRISSIAGVPAPATPTSPRGSLADVPDIVVPSTQTNPVTVALEGTNMPVGTVLKVTLTPARGSRATVDSTPLAGSAAASTATASLTLPDGMSVISALAVIDLTTTASANPLFMNGERVDRIEVAATFGGASRLTYITQSGQRIYR